MASVELDTAGVLEVVEWPDAPDAETLPNGNGTNTLNAATFVRKDTNGAWVPALGTAASNGAGARLLLKTIRPGQTGTAIRRGLVDGLNVSALNISATLYINDTGNLDGTTGTATLIAGRVAAGTANQITDARDKLVQIDLPI